MDKSIRAILQMIRAEVCGNAGDIGELPSFSEDELKELYQISKKHDLCHIIGTALDSRGLLAEGDPISDAFKKQIFKAVWRYEKLNFELERVCGLLEAAEIRHMPLKGSVLRNYYPKPWLRTSCDIDILVAEADLERAVNVINADGGYKVGLKDSHDISLYSAAGVHIELHYDLVEDGLVADTTRILREVWSYCSPAEGWSYRMRAADEFFYFYHMAHMAKHFKAGGCGIRPLIDEWILDHSLSHNKESRDALLSEAGLLTFADSIRRLSEVWFSGAETDVLTEKLEKFIVEGGVYGNQANRVAVQTAKKNDNKFKYLWSRIFERYDMLKFRYPILQKHRWLMPVMQVRRWFGLLNGNKAKRAISEVQTLGVANTDGVNEFLTEIGL